MSSIFDITNRTSKRKITKNFLKTHGFYIDRWGGPQDRQKPTSIFYEALYNYDIGIFPHSDENHTITASIKYFPEDFDGYATIGGKWGRGIVAGKLVITYENGRAFEPIDDRGWTDTLVLDCKSHTDFYNAIDFFNMDLTSKEYESIRF